MITSFFDNVQSLEVTVNILILGIEITLDLVIQMNSTDLAKCVLEKHTLSWEYPINKIPDLKWKMNRYKSDDNDVLDIV